MSGAEAPEDHRGGSLYDTVEGLHLRQWTARVVLPLALLASNGAGLLNVAALPRHDFPATTLGWRAAAVSQLWIVGLVLVFAAALLRIAGKGVLERKTAVTTGGAYRWCRHPFYLAVVMGGVGTFLLAGGLGVLVACIWAVVACPVYALTVAGEEAGLQRLHGDKWRAYASRVPAFIPYRGAAGPQPEMPVHITWRNLLDEREPPRLMRFLGSAALVGGTAWGGAPGIAVATGGAILHALSHLLPGGRRARSGRASG